MDPLSCTDAVATGEPTRHPLGIRMPLTERRCVIRETLPQAASDAALAIFAFAANQTVTGQVTHCASGGRLCPGAGAGTRGDGGADDPGRRAARRGDHHGRCADSIRRPGGRGGQSLGPQFRSHGVRFSDHPPWLGRSPQIRGRRGPRLQRLVPLTPVDSRIAGRPGMSTPEANALSCPSRAAWRRSFAKFAAPRQS